MITYYYVIYREMIGNRCTTTLVDDFEIAYSHNFLTFQQFVEERIEPSVNRENMGVPDVKRIESYTRWVHELDRGEVELPEVDTLDHFIRFIEDKYGDGGYPDHLEMVFMRDREIHSIILDEQLKPFVYLDEEFEMYVEAAHEPDVVYEVIAQCLNYINTMIDFVQKDSNLFDLWNVACGIIYYCLVSSEYAYFELGLEDYFTCEQLQIHPLYSDVEIEDLKCAYRIKTKSRFESIDPVKCFALEYEGLLPEWCSHREFG